LVKDALIYSYSLPYWQYAVSFFPAVYVLGIMVLIGGTLVLANKPVAGGALILLAILPILPIGVLTLVGVVTMWNPMVSLLVAGIGGGLAIHDGVSASPDVG
jgi:hypothetical protein